MHKINRLPYILLACCFALVLFPGITMAEEEESNDINVIPSDEVNDLTLTVEEYYKAHQDEWVIDEIARVEGYSGQDTMADYTIGDQVYSVFQYSPYRAVEPKSGYFYSVAPEELEKYEIQDDALVRLADDKSEVRFCIQELVNPENEDDNLLVFTFPDGITAFRKYSVSGAKEMNFAAVAFCHLNGVDAVVSDLNLIRTRGYQGRDYFKRDSHSDETVSVIYRI